MEKEKIANSTIYNQVRTILVQGIVVALLLSLGANLILSFRQENEARDQSLISAAQVMANAPVFMDTIDTNQANTYIKRTVKSVSSIDVLAVYDATGEPIAFYDLASGSHDVSQLAPLNKDIMDNLTQDDSTLLHNSDAPSGTDRCAYTAIYSTDGKISGFTMAGIYMRSIRKMIFLTLLSHVLVGVAALFFGSMLSLRLSRRIKDDLLGYEPNDFRRLFLQQMDILDGLDEGILAIDKNSTVVYLNRAASDMLRIGVDEAIGQPLKVIYPRSTIARVMRTGKTEYNISLESITHVSVISDRIPLRRDNQIEGAVAIFRNRTEVTRLAQDLTGVQHILEALRAYTHEFTNKLHVILGLMQLKEYDRAEEYVLRITQTRAQSIDYIRDRIHDPTIAALLIGKAYRAAELDIRFSLDPASVLYGNGQFMPVTAMITMLGNLIENAFDAMRGAPTDVPSEVTVSIREGARGLLLSVDDTGPGMTEEVKQHLFERGFSTKGEGRGTGLALVQEMIEAYHGTIRVESELGVGTSFIITLTEQS